MVVTLSRGGSEQVEVQRKSQVEDDEIDNINNNKNIKSSGGNKRGVAAVVYYLCRNGQLEHPHFMEVPLSSSHGLFLRDVLLRFNLLRGKSMAFLYSWSSKRSYKNGYVWHDLDENDYIHPVHGGDYVLKGSEILETASLLLSSPSPSPSLSLSKSPERPSSSNGNTNVIRRRNPIDLHEYKVYKTESSHESAAADASTQTDDKRRRRKAVVMEEPEIEEQDKTEKQQQSTELSGGEISPPPSDSSPETLESLMKADGRLIINSNSNSNSNSNNNKLGAEAVDDEAGEGDGKAEYYCPNGRMKASSVIMSVISCGSISFRECGETAVGMGRVGRGWNERSEEGGKIMKNEKDEKRKEDKVVRSRYGKMRLEDKEYYSGSLIETKNSNNKEDYEQLMYLKRSSSYNADHRSCHMKLVGKEEEGVRAKCIPRRQKPQPNNKKQSISQMTTVTVNTTPQTGNQN